MTTEELKQKQLALLEETAAFYNSNNRAENEKGGCYYTLIVNGEERGCAIGRKIADKSLCEKFNLMGGRNYSPSVKQVFYMIPFELQELGINFLTSIQSLHDIKDNWNLEGLSERGKKYVEDIKFQYKLG